MLSNQGLDLFECFVCCVDSDEKDFPKCVNASSKRLVEKILIAVSMVVWSFSSLEIILSYLSIWDRSEFLNNGSFSQLQISFWFEYMC